MRHNSEHYITISISDFRCIVRSDLPYSMCFFWKWSLIFDVSDDNRYRVFMMHAYPMSHVCRQCEVSRRRGVVCLAVVVVKSSANQLEFCSSHVVCFFFPRWNLPRRASSTQTQAQVQ